MYTMNESREKSSLLQRFERIAISILIILLVLLIVIGILDLIVLMVLRIPGPKL